MTTFIQQAMLGTIAGAALPTVLAVSLAGGLFQPAEEPPGPATIMAAEPGPAPEPEPDRRVPRSIVGVQGHQHQRDEDGIDCEVCQAMLARVAVARLTVEPPVVTRPDAWTIVVEGATYAGTRPYSWPIRGVPIHMADIVHVQDTGEPIWFMAQAVQDYDLWAVVIAPDGTGVPFDFTVLADRPARIEAMYRHRIEAQWIYDQLGTPPTFLETVAAYQRIYSGGFPGQGQPPPPPPRPTIERPAWNAPPAPPATPTIGEE